MAIKRKKVYYSYLLNGERCPSKALIACINGDGNKVLSFLHKNRKAAIRARENDCYDGENKRGLIVKISLETLKEIK